MSEDRIERETLIAASGGWPQEIEALKTRAEQPSV